MLRDYPGIQIVLLLAISIVVQILLIFCKPFVDDAKICLFNEFMVSSYLYLMLTLTDLNRETQIKEKLGWSLLILVLFTVFVNLVKAGYYDSKNFLSWLSLNYQREKRREASKYPQSPSESLPQPTQYPLIPSQLLTSQPSNFPSSQHTNTLTFIAI